MRGQGVLFGCPQQLKTSDDYYTPQWVFGRLGLDFDIDVAAPPGGCQWIPARRFFTKADDGLTQPWEGRVWMNPPFSDATPWVERFVSHGHGVALLPHAKSKWHSMLWASVDAIATPTNPHLKFVGGGIFLPVMFAAMGADCAAALSGLGPVMWRRP